MSDVALNPKPVKTLHLKFQEDDILGGLISDVVLQPCGDCPTSLFVRSQACTLYIPPTWNQQPYAHNPES